MTYAFVVGLILLAALPACSKKESSRSAAAGAPHKHEHKPPHGGTPVVLGAETYHLELVRDADAGKLTVYVMDGELENFIRIAAPSIGLSVNLNGKPTSLMLPAVANTTTGEKVGDTAQFEVVAEWLKTTPSFDATLPSIEIRGTVFTATAFNFPKGNDKD